MQTKNQVSLTRKTLYGIMLFGLFFSAFGVRNLPTAQAQDGTTDPPPTPEVTETPIPDVEGQIVGGALADPGEYPWQVALVGANAPANDFWSGPGYQFCGGSLIHPQWVLTAAHCITESNGSVSLSPSIDVVAGIYNLLTPTAGFQRRDVIQIIRHPAYNDNTYDNDIALLQLASAITIGGSGATTTFLIPPVPSSMGSLTGTSSWITGWGNTSATPPDNWPTQLREVQLPIIDNSICNDASHYNGQITGNMMCAGYDAGGQDSCQGDSGGPLIVLNPGTSQWNLAGVVSWGDGCAQPYRQGVYTRVSRYGSWIQSYLLPATTLINATIAGTSQGTYPMNPETSLELKYLVDGGPVVIGSDNGANIIASLNQWRRNAAQPQGWFTGVAQSMALPVEQITNRYVMPRYNGTNPTLYDAVLMANVDTVPRTITVTIGGTVMGTYPLNPSQSVYATYPITGGPIVVSSDSGAKIVASLYELKRSQAGVPWNGQSEMMGLPAGQLSDKYLLPIYFGVANPATLDARLYFANVDTVATTVEVKIAGVSRGTYPMAPSTSMEVKYLVDGGPVEISSNNGAKIVASLNQWRRNAAEPQGWFTGVAQSMALPVELITDKYVIPRYNGTDPTLYDAVLMANVDTVPRTITVKIGATVMGTYPLAPSASVYATYPITDGPIVVSSDVGAKIVASLYELKRYQAGVPWNGQSEMMGLPIGQLSDQYLLPIYFGAANPLTLDARLYIAVP